MADVLISQVVQRYSKNLGIIKLDLPPSLWGAIRKAFYLLKALIVWNWLRSKRVSRWYPDRPHISLGNSLLSITVTRRHHYMPQLSLIFFPLPLIPLLLSCLTRCAAGLLQQVSSDRSWCTSLARDLQLKDEHTWRHSHKGTTDLWLSFCCTSFAGQSLVSHTPLLFMSLRCSFHAGKHNVLCSIPWGLAYIHIRKVSLHLCLLTSSSSSFRVAHTFLKMFLPAVHAEILTASQLCRTAAKNEASKTSRFLSCVTQFAFRSTEDPNVTDGPEARLAVNGVALPCWRQKSTGKTIAVHSWHCNHLVTNNQVLLKTEPLQQEYLPPIPRAASEAHLFGSLWSTGIEKPAAESTIAASPKERQLLETRLATKPSGPDKRDMKDVQDPDLLSEPVGMFFFDFLCSRLKAW